MAVQLDLEAIDGAIGLDHAFREGRIALHQGPHAAADDLLDPAAHDQELFAQVAELLLVLPVGVLACVHGLSLSPQPKRPVM